MSEPVVRIGKREITHAVIKQNAGRTADALSELGVGPGDRVAIVMRNDPDFLMISAACGLIGAIPVPANWHWRWAELRHVISHSGARAVFAHSNLAQAVEEVIPQNLPLIEVPVHEELVAAYGAAPPTGRHTMLADFVGEREPLTGQSQAAPLVLIYTSGTTGLPKGVIRSVTSPEQSTRVARATLSAMGLDPGMSTLVTAPLYHAAPNSQGLFALTLGMDVTLMPRFDPEEFLRLIETHRITHAQAVPTMFVRLLELPEEVRKRYDLSSLRCVVHAAAPCPAHVKHRMIDWWGPILLEYYGGTETGIVVKCDTAQWLAHEGTVGRLFGGADAQVFDPQGNPLPRGETGEIYIRPPDFWPGFTYLGQEDNRREIDRDGYISIGDIGRVDEEGYLYLSDRARDMVISGGVNIYPVEIENCLLELHGVRDVAVFGIPDESYGEVLAAHVDADPAAGLDEDAIRTHVRGRLAGYKVPKIVVFDDALPREATGKIFKRRIRDRYWHAAGRSL